MNLRPFFRFSLLLPWLPIIAMALPAAPAERTLVFFGDSLTAGYGLADPASQSYPALIGQKIVAAHLPWRVVNAGLSGDTSAGGRSRIDWVLRQPIDLLALELGANDGLRGLDPNLTRRNLEAIIERVRQKSPATRIVLIGMQMPSNLGADYTRAFAALFPAVAAEEQVPLIPFLLEGVGGHADLNQADGIHPTAEGHIRVAGTVWATLRPLLTAPP